MQHSKTIGKRFWSIANEYARFWLFLSNFVWIDILLSEIYIPWNVQCITIGWFGNFQDRDKWKGNLFGKAWRWRKNTSILDRTIDAKCRPQLFSRQSQSRFNSIHQLATVSNNSSSIKKGAFILLWQNYSYCYCYMHYEMLWIFRESISEMQNAKELSHYFDPWLNWFLGTALPGVIYLDIDIYINLIILHGSSSSSSTHFIRINTLSLITSQQLPPY